MRWLIGITKYIMWLPTRGGIEHLSHLAALVAVGIGFWALAHPETVNEYLQRVTAATTAAAENTADIATSSKEISVNSDKIASEIPEWIQIDSMIGRCRQSCDLVIEIKNATNFDFVDISVVLINKKGQRRSFQEITLPARESMILTASALNGIVKNVCIGATSTKSGEIRFDIREIKLVSVENFITKSRAFSPTPTTDCNPDT